VLSSHVDPVPHRYPFRLVERVETMGGQRVVVALISAGGSLTGPTPWPVSLIAEALAQSVLLVFPPRAIQGLRLLGLDDVRVFQAVRTGDRLEVRVEELVTFGSLRRFAGRAVRSGALVAAAVVTVSCGSGQG
jgi:3-hydroxymyristoyl/3-hydroxydecanoyl-(acyl carrier protein) dehydratase